MKSNSIIKQMGKGLGMVTIQLKKHSPEILMAAGIIGTVASTVLACKATLKLTEVINEGKDDIEKIHEISQNPEMANKYSKEDAAKDLAVVYAQIGLKVIKLYGPSIILGAFSISGMVTSNNILKKRNLAIAAAYTAIDKTFKDYRGRVVDRFGEQVDKELRYDIKTKKIEQTTTDPETGKTKKVKKDIDILESGENDFVRFFDETCDGYENDTEYNMMFLRAQQQYANDLLCSRGHLFLNEVYDSLGMARTKAGQILGWIHKPNAEDNEKGDNYVDFRITTTHRMINDNEYEEVILIDPNVDGDVLSLI